MLFSDRTLRRPPGTGKRPASRSQRGALDPCKDLMSPVWHNAVTSSFQRVVIVTYVALPSIPKAAVGEQMSEEQPSSNREGPARQPTGSNPGGPKPFWRRTPFLMVVPPLALVMIITVVGCVSSSSTSSPTASSSASAQASQPSGSPSASAGGSPPTQANPAFPYEPGGVTYSGGVGGGVDTFSIPAGSYSENTQASYDPANDPSDTGECLFSGAFDYLSGSGFSAPLGGNAPITAMSPINGPPVKLTLAAGDYKIDIYPATTCSWTVELVP